MKRRGSFTFDSEHLTKQGRTIFTEVTVNYLQYEGREYNCAVMRTLHCESRPKSSGIVLWNQSGFALHRDLNGFLLQTNPAWNRVLLWSEEDLRQHPWMDFIHPDDREQTQRQFQLVVSGQSITTLSSLSRSKRGMALLSVNIIPYSVRT